MYATKNSHSRPLKTREGGIIFGTSVWWMHAQQTSSNNTSTNTYKRRGDRNRKCTHVPLLFVQGLRAREDPAQVVLLVGLGIGEPVP